MLPLKLYLTLEKKRKAAREAEAKDTKEKEAAEKGVSVEELKKDAPQNFDAECEHIHNKVLFDCINDSLLQFKPFGKDGEPLPWSRQSRRLKPTDDFNLNEIFEIVKHDLVSKPLTSITDKSLEQPLSDCVFFSSDGRLTWQERCHGESSSTKENSMRNSSRRSGKRNWCSCSLVR